jgi:hypothetical protein
MKECLMLRSLFASALALACLTGDALAQTHTDKSGTIVPGFAPVPNLGSGAYLPATVGTSDQTILAAGAGYYFLDLVNLSPSATICINFGASATISGSACTAGEITLPPLWHRSFEGSFVPTDSIHAIASAASTPASVGTK